MQLSDLPIAEAPLIELLRQKRKRHIKAGADPLTELDQPAAIDKAIHYLQHNAPEAVEGAGGDHVTFQVAARLRDFGLSIETAFDLLGEHWNEAGKAHPAWGADDLMQKVENAFRYGTGAWGGALGVAEFDDATVLLPAPKAKRPRLFYVPFADAARLAVEEPPEPLVEHLLDQHTLAVMYGASNSGKTFTALDIAYHIGTGRKWNGREVAQGLVVYVAAEGGRGILRRAAALGKRYGAKAALAIVPCPVDLRDPKADTKPLIELVREIEAAEGAKALMVVIDTLSRALAGGDENGPVDMGAFVQNVDRIRAATTAAVLVVHHSGKDAAKGARGHSLLRAATDTEIEIIDNKIRVTKQRDMEAAKEMAFRLDEVEIGRDARGRAITSCIVRIVAASEFMKIEPTPAEQAMLDALENAAREKNPDNWSGQVVTTDEWDKEYLSGFEAMSQTCPSPRHRSRLRTCLTEKGHVTKVQQAQWVMSG